MRKLYLVAISGLLMAGCGGGGGDNPAPDAGPPPVDPCQIKSESEATPGFPFNYGTFRNDVWPTLQASCGLSGCHLQPNGAGNYSVWGSADGACPDAESFNAFYEVADFRVNPANSKAVTAIDGTLATHPPVANAADIASSLLAYIQDAYDTANPGQGPGDLTGFFEQNTYETVIDPAIQQANCTAAGCHNVTDKAGNFGINVNPAAGSAEMDENFQIVTSYVALGNITDATQSKLYAFSTNAHRGIQLGVQEASALEQFIKAAIDAFGGDGGGATGCVNVRQFNTGVFEEEILPVLRGDVDLNDRDGGRTTTGCMRSECHARQRGTGTLYLDPFAPVEQNLENFSCYIDLLNPSNSQVLLCPLKLNGCQKVPHPGDDIFFGVDDRNYQRLLSFIYATQNGASPLDFAFFVRKINVLFNDETAVQDGNLGLTCADTNGCHGVLFPGQDVPGGSNFAILPEATEEADLVFNYFQAANFTFFPDATQSSLFLYPTNEIANVNNDLATGLPHPGGEDFAVNDQEAIDILQWAGGLRPNGQGLLQNFLVAGDFPATDVTDEEIPGEATIQPRIFERSGQPLQFNQGEWDGFFSAVELIDLNDPEQGFLQDQAFDRLVYAVAYVVNTTSRDLRTVVTVTSPNDVELFVGDSNTIGRDGAGAALTVNLPSYRDSKEVTRILLKVFQKAADEQFEFTMQFADDNGNLLTDVTKELVFTLSNVDLGI
ncbi:hypothetical protein [Haliangium sp.]|uniref:hypothetical protein n=1 Tax=Haliangium sp. TaxID=2663208 RepID=UPI003D09ED25